MIISIERNVVLADQYNTMGGLQVVFKIEKAMRILIALKF